MSDSPVVSVCMPVYNSERYVGEAVESILGQTFTDFEFLIVNDGSTDGSRAILEKLAARDPRIRLINRPNGGYVSALNQMVREARGEFLARMDSDDVSLPLRLERQVAYLREHPDCVAVGSRARVIDAEGDPITVWFTVATHEEIDAYNLDPMQGGALCHPSILMRRDVVLELGGYDESFRIAEDMDLWLRLAERGRLANLQEIVFQYRTHGKNSSAPHFSKDDEDRVEIIRRACRRRGLPEPTFPPPSPPATAEDRRSDYERWGWQAYNSHHIGTARKYARRLVAIAPWELASWRLFYCAHRWSPARPAKQAAPPSP